MKIKRTVTVIALVVIVCTALVGCRQSDRVSYNLSKEADYFNITRRLAVINARTDEPIFELIGNFSIETNSNDELEITVETGAETYKKHFVYLNEWTVYVVEDVSGAYVDKYHYEVNFLPEMIIPVTGTMND